MSSQQLLDAAVSALIGGLVGLLLAKLWPKAH